MSEQMEKDNPAAFPRYDTMENIPGMRLRDYFAAKALNGMLSAKNYDEFTVIAALAYKAADAMLAERDKK